MSSDINPISAGYEDSEKVSELQRVASQMASGLRSKMHIVGNVVLIEEAEKLGPVAYKCDDAGMRSFEMHGYTYEWYHTRYYEGMLEGHGSTELPDDHYLLWFIKDGDLYLKWVQGRYEQMKNEIRLERVDLRNRMYWTAVKQSFLKLLKKIQIEKQAS